MKLGLLFYFGRSFPGLNLEETFRKISSMGFEAVELWASTLGLPSGPDTLEIPLEDGRAKKIKELAAKYDLTVSALSSHFNHLEPKLEERNRLSHFFKDVLTAASKLDISVVTTVSGNPLPGKSDDENWSEFRNQMGQHVDYATDLGIKIAVESCHGGGPSKNLVFNVPAMDRMFKEIPSKTLGVNFDPSHCVWQGIDYIAAVKRWRNRIYHAHAKDTEILWDVLKTDGVQAGYLQHNYWMHTWWRFRIPGWGEVNWKKLITTYKEIGYDYVISLEHHDPVFKDFEEGARKTVAFLKPLLV